MLDASISSLNLSARTEFCLKRAKILTIQELSWRSEQDLREIEYLGSKAIQEIVETLGSKGLELDKDPSEFSRFEKRFRIFSDPLCPPIKRRYNKQQEIKITTPKPCYIDDLTDWPVSVTSICLKFRWYTLEEMRSDLSHGKVTVEDLCEKGIPEARITHFCNFITNKLSLKIYRREEYRKMFD